MEKPGCLANGGRLFLSSMFLLPGIVLYFIAGWEGIPQSLFFALLFTLGLRWGVLGLMGFFKPLPPRAATYGSAIGLAVLMALAGPTVSNSYYAKKEPDAWLKVSAVPQTSVWERDYNKVIPEKFRRAEWASRYAEVRCKEALANKDFKAMRAVAVDIFSDKAKLYDEQSRKAVQTAYRELFADGLASIKPTKLANPKMVAAFKKALDAVAANPLRRLVLVVDAQGSPGPIPDDKGFMAGLQPQYAKLPILAVGDAFGPKSESRRAQTTRTAIQGSLNAVIPPDLAEVELSQEKPGPQDVLFKIEAQVKRIPGFYVNSSDNVPDAFLYKMEAHWKFRVVVDGKPLGEFAFRSEPAKSVQYSTNPGDPQWAPYSIMMDSASDNFARLVVGSLGLTPPPEKDSYSFTPNDPPPAPPAPPQAAPTP